MKIDVWKYIRTILMRLGAFWKEKLDHPDRALSLCTAVCGEVFAGTCGEFVEVCVVACVLQRAERRSWVHLIHVLQCVLQCVSQCVLKWVERCSRATQAHVVNVS